MAVTLAQIVSGPVVPALSVSSRSLMTHLAGATQPCPTGSCCSPSIGIVLEAETRDTLGPSVLPSFLGQQILLPREGQSLIKIVFPCSSFIQQIFIEHPIFVSPVSVCQGHHCEQSTVLPSGHSPCLGGQAVNRPTWDICSSTCCKSAKGVLFQEGCQASEPSNF